MSDNNKNELDDYTRIVNHAHDQIDRVRSDYKFAGGLIAAIFIAAITLTYGSINELNKRMDEKVIALEKKVSLRIEEQFQTNEINKLIDSTAKNIVEEKATEEIKKAVQDNIASTVVKITKDLNDTQKRLEITKVEINNQVEDINSNIDQSDELLGFVTNQTKYMVKVIEASLDSRIAYEQLLKWANNKSYQLHSEAEKAAHIISRQYVSTIPAHVDLIWKNAKYKKKTAKELFNDFGDSAVDMIGEPGFIDLIHKEKDIPNTVKEDFYILVIKGPGKSLSALSLAGRRLSKLVGVKFTHPLNFDQTVKAWEEKRKKR